jgi:hypothetical protein
MRPTSIKNELNCLARADSCSDGGAEPANVCATYACKYRSPVKEMDVAALMANDIGALGPGSARTVVNIGSARPAAVLAAASMERTPSG